MPQIEEIIYTTLKSHSMLSVSSNDGSLHFLHCEDIINSEVVIKNFTEELMTVIFDKASGIKITLLGGQIYLDGEIDNDCKITVFNDAELIGPFTHMAPEDSATEVDPEESSYSSTPYSSNGLPDIDNLTTNHSGPLIGRCKGFDEDEELSQE